MEEDFLLADYLLADDVLFPLADYPDLFIPNKPPNIWVPSFLKNFVVLIRPPNVHLYLRCNPSKKH